MVAVMQPRGVEAVHAGFLGYEHTGTPPDGGLTRNALHRLLDLWKTLALNRLARLLRPDGVLRLRDLVYSFEPAEADAAMAQWLCPLSDHRRLGHARARQAGGHWFEPITAHLQKDLLSQDIRRLRSKPF
jgi:hypothetical protein